jgi:Flp pilus assembly protein CpaB
VTPRQAERIVAANSMGSIQLTLRNPSELAVAEETPAPVRRVSSNGGTSFTIIRGTDVSVIRR